MSDRLKKKCSYFISLSVMIAILIGIAYVGFMRKMDIDVMKNVKLEYTGENGNASLKVRNSGSSIDQRTEAFMETVKYTADKSTDLSNGDKVEITATYDKDMAKQYNFKAINLTEEITVEGLPDQYASLSKIDRTYLEDIENAAESYVSKHSTTIYQVEVDEEADHPHLDQQTVKYACFMKSQESRNSDRVLEIVQMDYTEQNTKTTLYYMVVVPEINDSNEVTEQDIYGLKATMSSDEIQSQAFKDYVSRVFSNKYNIEDIQIK